MDEALARRERLQKRLGYDWNNPDLLTEALTHSTFGNENKTAHSERLEFLGDAVLDLVTAEWLMAEYPREREGMMSQKRAELVRKCALAARAREIELDQALYVGTNADYLRKVESVLADAMEAVIGAIFRDSGDMMQVRLVVRRVGIIP